MRSCRILCADGNKFVRRVICTILRQAGMHDIVEAESTSMLIRHMRQEVPDLILVDWHMRARADTNALKAIQDAQRLYSIRVPVLVLTDAPTPQMVRETVMLGADGVLCKPVSPKLLMGRIAALLNPRPGRSEMRERVYL